MHQNAFGGRTLPGPAVGAPSAPPDPLAVFDGRAGPRKEKENGEGKRKGEEEGEGEKGSNYYDDLAQ